MFKVCRCLLVATVLAVPRMLLAAPFVYVANAGSANVTVVDAATNTVAATVAVGNNPRNPAVSPDGTRVYVPNRDSNTVTVIDGVTHAVVKTITDTGFDEPYSAAVSPDGSRVYVANKKGSGSSTGSLTVIDGTHNNKVMTTITHACFSSPEWVTVNPAGTRAYVVNKGGDSICVVNTGTNSVLKKVGVGGKYGAAPRSAVVSCDGAYVYVANDRGNPDITKIRTSDNTVVGGIEFTGASGPRNMSITPDGTKIYTGFRGSKVGIVDTRSDTPSTITVSGASGLYATAVIADGSRVYVTSERGKVYVIDTASDTPLTGSGLPIPAGSGSRGLATPFTCLGLNRAQAPAVATPAVAALALLLLAGGVLTLRRCRTQ